MPLLALPQALRTICRVSAISCLTFCCPAFAQSQTQASTEIQSCVKKAEFYPNTFFGTQPTFVATRVNEFVACLKASSNPKNPEVEYWLGQGYKFEPVSPSGWLDRSRIAFCSAAAQGYVLAQEECALASFEDKKAQYHWTLAAARNGSYSAQVSVSTGAWGQVVEKAEREYDNYLVNYLACHPAMFREQCSWADDSALNTECRQNMREAAALARANIAQCHKNLDDTYFGGANSSVLSTWRQRAGEQMLKTLENIRQQVKRYPGLAHLQAIDP